MTRVLIVEDHRIVAEGLTLGLESEGYDVRFSDGSPVAMAAACEEFDPEIVLLDLDLGDHGSGVDLIPALVAEDRTVIVLTGIAAEDTLAEAYAAGAHAVIDKTIPFPQLVDEMAVVHKGESVFAEQRRHEVMRAYRLSMEERARRLEPFSRLTPREEEVLTMLVEGFRATDIAEVFYVSLSTVRSHIKSILAKLGVGSQLAVVSMALRSGWVEQRREPSSRGDGLPGTEAQ